MNSKRGEIMDMVTSTSNTVNHETNNTGDRGSLLGVIRPPWRNVVEGETRLDWLQKMVKKKLVVQDIEAYGKAQSELLR